VRPPGWLNTPPNFILLVIPLQIGQHPKRTGEQVEHSHSVNRARTNIEQPHSTGIFFCRIRSSACLTAFTFVFVHVLLTPISKHKSALIGFRFFRYISKRLTRICSSLFLWNCSTGARAKLVKLGPDAQDSINPGHPGQVFAKNYIRSFYQATPKKSMANYPHHS
jgi:hypothetical protein